MATKYKPAPAAALSTKPNQTLADVTSRIMANLQSPQTVPMKSGDGCAENGEQITLMGTQPNGGTSAKQSRNLPACPLCSGLGHVRRNVPAHHPDFGKAIPCECQAEAIAARRIAKLERADGMTDYERTYRFGSEMPGQIEAAKILRGLVDQQTPAGIATLTGNYGVGKTRLLIAAANLAKSNGVAAHYTTARKLLNFLRQSFNDNGGMNFDQRFDMLVSTPVLVIDELDKVKTSDWALEQFSGLIDDRWRYMRERLTIFAMNAPMRKLPDDIQDRLEDAQAHVITLAGRSLRNIEF